MANIFINKRSILLAFVLIFFYSGINAAQIDSLASDVIKSTDSLLKIERDQAMLDSLIKSQLRKELEKVKTNDKRKDELEARLREIEDQEVKRKSEQLKKIEQLKLKSTGYPVTLLKDTLFYLFTNIGSFSPEERAERISDKIKRLYQNDALVLDSIILDESETTSDIVFEDEIIMSVTDYDALWQGNSRSEMAKENLLIIRDSIQQAWDDNTLFNWVKKILLVLLIIAGVTVLIKFINRLFRKTKSFLQSKREIYFKGISVRNFQLLNADQHLQAAFGLNNIVRIATIIVSLYLSLPLLFSVFPETRGWTNLLLGWVLKPAKSVFSGIISYLPNLFTILVIYFFTRYTVRFFKYLSHEIEKGNLVLPGFYKEWAQPTFNIVKFLLYVFMFIVVFPYLPGSSSPVFQGVSVFLGVLLSFGSSSAISNVIAGLVITYMRPFRNGDRVKIGEVTGDVVEKTLLVTRIRTIKNEDITVPNSSVLSGYTVNYSTHSHNEGLILHTTVTIGYDIPWKDMHQALIDAALRTPLIEKTPAPFVLQTSLDDFYISYQLNAFTRNANKQAVIYSDLHQQIQDVCNERGIEILSPHYRAMRDGNATTIPANYLPLDYQSPSFKIKHSEK